MFLHSLTALHRLQEYNFIHCGSFNRSSFDGVCLSFPISNTKLFLTCRCRSVSLGQPHQTKQSAYSQMHKKNGAQIYASSCLLDWLEISCVVCHNANVQLTACVIHSPCSAQQQLVKCFLIATMNGAKHVELRDDMKGIDIQFLTLHAQWPPPPPLPVWLGAEKSMV